MINACGESEFRFVREEKQLGGRVVSPVSPKLLLNEKRMKKNERRGMERRMENKQIN